MSRIKHWGVAIGATALVAVAAAATYQYATSEAAGSVSGGSAETVNAASSALPPAGATDDNGGSGNASVAASPSDPRGGRGTFIVVLKEAPLATYKGSVAGISAPERQFDIRGKNRINVDGTESQEYVDYLELRQSQIETRMSTMMGRDVNPRMTMQHAINAMVVDLSASEAKAVQGMPEVRFVEAYREYQLETDTGPALIGAPPVWTGTNPGSGGQQYRGEGTVLGIIDSGINFGSPSFAAVGPVDGYTHINPFGAGTYVGTCAAGEVDAGRCNDKLIGGYDFVCGAPANQCGVSGITEEPGFGDTNGHGSHTASTAAGNTRDALFAGGLRRISGVAPRANIIAYDVCYTNSAGQGLCPNVSALAAIDQAISDGVVDVINYSIGGGASPWSEAVSLAFLDAVDAGIYVAASAGNSGPAANTLSHNEPWVASSAAAQHGRGAFGVAMSVTGPAPVPANLAPLIINEGTGGVSLTATLPGTTPLRISAGISTTSDGCAAYPANTFAGAIAVIRRGTCSFSIKANNASAAGAIAVIIANNQAGVILPSVPGTTVPVFSVTQAEGDALRTFGQANPTTTTAQITYPAVGIPNTPDVLASFSSRGPAGDFNLLKPDATAPGVNVLAVLSGTTSVTGSEQLVGLLSGTSMASPHHAGSAMLIRQARPSWTVPEIKSALSLTANQTVYTEDSVTLANPFARGSGRIQVDRAINAGLVMNETAANYFAADPAATPAGDPTTLNQPNLINRSCFPTCIFNRTFRNTRATTETWRVQLENIRGAFPSFITLTPGGTITAKFTVYGSIYPNNGTFNYGNVVLTSVPTDGSAPQVLRMPIAIAVQPPVVSLPIAGLTMSMPTNGVNSVYFNIGNTGGSTLTYNFVSTGTASSKLYEALTNGVASGFRSVVYTDPATAGSQGQFSADDITITDSIRIGGISADGFVVSGGLLSTVATNLTWSIYPDAGGLPAGNPITAPGAAVWTYTATPTSAGVSTTSAGSINLDLVAAGQTVNLAPGRYWVVVNTRSTFANRWAWLGSTQGTGGGFASLTVPTTGTPTWTVNPSFAGLSLRVTGLANCASPWIGGTYAASGSLARGTSRSALTVLYGTGLAPGNYRGLVCVQSNDPVNPRVGMPVSLTITP